MPHQSRPGPNRRKPSPTAPPWPTEFGLSRDAATLRHPSLPLNRREIREIMARILDVARLALPFGQPGLELRITSDRGITDLHQRHLDGAGPTNVLSFPVDAAPDSKSGPNAIRGSIVISADAVLREAFLYGQSPRDHFIRLLTHALLHLAGLDHGETMDDLTEQVVEHLREALMLQRPVHARSDITEEVTTGITGDTGIIFCTSRAYFPLIPVCPVVENLCPNPEMKVSHSSNSLTTVNPEP